MFFGVPIPREPWPNRGPALAGLWRMAIWPFADERGLGGLKAPPRLVFAMRRGVAGKMSGPLYIGSDQATKPKRALT